MLNSLFALHHSSSIPALKLVFRADLFHTSIVPFISVNGLLIHVCVCVCVCFIMLCMIMFIKTNYTFNLYVGICMLHVFLSLSTVSLCKRSIQSRLLSLLFSGIIQTMVTCVFTSPPMAALRVRNLAKEPPRKSSYAVTNGATSPADQHQVHTTSPADQH